MSKQNIIMLILTVLLLNKVQTTTDSKEEQAKKPVAHEVKANSEDQEMDLYNSEEEELEPKIIHGAGFEMECKIPSGPYRGGDEILFRTSKWEVHPDTIHRNCDCEHSRCVHTEFATIGPLTDHEFVLAARDAGHFFNNFNVYGYPQIFKKNSKLIFVKTNKDGDIVDKEKDFGYNFAPEGIEVEKGFEVKDAKHIHPEKNGDFSCVAQLTASIDKYNFYQVFDTYHNSYGDKKFQKSFDGSYNTSLAAPSDDAFVFLNNSAAKYKQLFSDSAALSLFYLTAYYFVNLFRMKSFRARSLELKYNIDVLSRIAFSDMFDNLKESARQEYKRAILSICSELDDEAIEENLNDIVLDHLTKCSQFRLVDYVNEETEKQHPLQNEDRLTFSKWLFSVIDPSLRKNISYLQGQDRSVETRKTDLLSPPDGLRVMNSRPLKNTYHYGMGKYVLDNKQVFLVEFRSIGGIRSMKNIKNYEKKMNEMFNFLYLNVGRFDDNQVDIFDSDGEDDSDDELLI